MQPCPSAKASRYPGRLPLPRYRRSAVSRRGAGPGRCRRGQQSNVHLRWGTDNLMDQLAETPARKDCGPPKLEPWSPGGVPVGPRRRGRNSPCPTDRQDVPDRRPNTKLSRNPDRGPTPQGPSLMDPSNSHIPILKGPFDETTPASPISPRARHPRRASAPGPAHAETPTPRN